MLLERGAWRAPVHTREDVALPRQCARGSIEGEQPTAAEAAVNGGVRIWGAEDHQLFVAARTRHDTVGAVSLGKGPPYAGTQKRGLTHRRELPQEGTGFRIECIEPAARTADKNA